MDLEVRHLRCFLVLAEELNFTRAAGRLGVPQPALSTQIRRIERHLGIQLFDRTTRSVALTDAGRRMLPLARAVDRSMHSLEAQMRAPESPRRLRFGTDDHPLTAQMAAVEAAFTGLTFELRTIEPPDSFAAVSEGGLDLVFGYESTLMPAAVGPDVRLATITDLPWWVALPKSHRLADADRVRLADLAEDAWFARPAGTPLYAMTMAQCQQYGGFTPDIRYTTIRTDVMFELLEQGRAVGFAAPTTGRYGGPFSLLPLVEDISRRLLLAWRPAAVPPGVAEAVLEQLREMYAAQVRESPKFLAEVQADPVRYPHISPLL